MSNISHCIAINFFYHPDFNCRFWNFTKSVLLQGVADYTAGRESRPAPKKIESKLLFILSYQHKKH